MARKGVNGSCGCGWFEGILERIAALTGRVDIVEQGKEDKLPDGSDGQILATNGHSVYWKNDDVRDIVDDLTSTRTDAALSANQGRALKEDIADVLDYAEAIGEELADIDTEIHTARPYVDTTTDQTIDGIKTFDVVKVSTPNSGDSTDTVPNIAYISTTGANALNNLLHTNGNEVKKGRFTIEEGVLSGILKTKSNTNKITASTGTDYIKIGECAPDYFTGGSSILFIVWNPKMYSTQQITQNGIIQIMIRKTSIGSYNGGFSWVAKGANIPINLFITTIDSGGYVELWMKASSDVNNTISLFKIAEQNENGEDKNWYKPINNGEVKELTALQSYPNYFMSG